jgi:flavin-dependent dehydrogenase
VAYADDADVEASVSERRYDTIVVGAGVAGAAFAAGVAGRGRVLLVERSAWPREKVCGCCLNTAALSALAGLGLADAVDKAGCGLDRVVLRSRGRCAEVARPRGLAVSRRALDGLLVERFRQLGGEFRSSTAGAIVGREGDRWLVRLRTGEGEETVSAALVAAADGLTGGSLDGVEGFASVAGRGSWFGVGDVGASRACPVASGVVEMNIGRHGYVGLVRLRDGSINLASALDPAWTKRVGGPSAAVASVLSEAGARVDVEEFSLRGTGLLTRRRERVSAEGLLVLGDAAGYVEPFTGEGIAWGLAGAEAAAEMVNRGLGGAELGAAWSRWHASRIRSRQRACFVVRGVLRRPWLVSATLGLMRTAPAAARLAASIASRLERPYSGPAAGASA